VKFNAVQRVQINHSGFKDASILIPQHILLDLTHRVAGKLREDKELLGLLEAGDLWL